MGPFGILNFFLKRRVILKEQSTYNKTTPAQSCFKYIIWFSNLSILIVPDDGYFDRT
jgi:hypothetical protein